MAENSESEPSALRGDSLGLEMGGARNGEDMNGEERDDKERTRSHAERLGESNWELGALADRRGGGAEVKSLPWGLYAKAKGARGREKPVRESG